MTFGLEARRRGGFGDFAAVWDEGCSCTAADWVGREVASGFGVRPWFR